MREQLEFLYRSSRKNTLEENSDEENPGQKRRATHNTKDDESGIDYMDDLFDQINLGSPLKKIVPKYVFDEFIESQFKSSDVYVTENKIKIKVIEYDSENIGKTKYYKYDSINEKIVENKRGHETESLTKYHLVPKKEVVPKKISESISGSGGSGSGDSGGSGSGDSGGSGSGGSGSSGGDDGGSGPNPTRRALF